MDLNTQLDVGKFVLFVYYKLVPQQMNWDKIFIIKKTDDEGQTFKL